MNKYKLVPVEPTIEMAEAACLAECNANRNYGEPASFSDIWDAMIAAAPAVQGEHYQADEWIPSNGTEPDLPDGTLVDVKFRDGCIAGGRGTHYWSWEQDVLLGDLLGDITHYRIHQPAEQQPAPDVEMLVEALECALETMENVDGANDCSRGIDAVEEALAAHRIIYRQTSSGSAYPIEKFD